MATSNFLRITRFKHVTIIFGNICLKRLLYHQHKIISCAFVSVNLQANCYSSNVISCLCNFMTSWPKPGAVTDLLTTCVSTFSCLCSFICKLRDCWRFALWEFILLCQCSGSRIHRSSCGSCPTAVLFVFISRSKEWRFQFSQHALTCRLTTLKERGWQRRGQITWLISTVKQSNTDPCNK